MDDNKTYTRKNSLRYRGFDYSSAGYYFVTICTDGKKHILSEISDDGTVKLTNVGEILNEVWSGLPLHFANVKTDDFVVMPNHIHGIIVIEKCCGTTLNEIVKAFKSIATLQCRKKYGNTFKLWQRGFYDEIIETEDHYYNVKWYITCNPRNWKTDKYRF